MRVGGEVLERRRYQTRPRHLIPSCVEHDSWIQWKCGHAFYCIPATCKSEEPGCEPAGPHERRLSAFMVPTISRVCFAMFLGWSSGCYPMH